MKRGVFMLILNLNCEGQYNKKVKKRYLKTRKNNSLERYSINVNGKNAIVLELTEDDLSNSDVLTLLKIYKGRVLASVEYVCKENIKEYLFDPVDYYKRALISSLINQLKTINRDWMSVSIKTKCFKPFKELYELVRISKAITIITDNNASTHKFLNECYNEYGAIVSVDKECYKRDAVFMNLDEIDNKGKLMISVKGREFLLYPDNRYFENSVEYQKLSKYNIEHSIICAAFSDK